MHRYLQENKLISIQLQVQGNSMNRRGHINNKNKSDINKKHNGITDKIDLTTDDRMVIGNYFKNFIKECKLMGNLDGWGHVQMLGIIYIPIIPTDTYIYHTNHQYNNITNQPYSNINNHQYNTNNQRYNTSEGGQMISLLYYNLYITIITNNLVHMYRGDICVHPALTTITISAATTWDTMVVAQHYMQ